MNKVKYIINGIFIVHFTILVIHIVAKNSGLQHIESWTVLYTDPFFIQEWEMFAPPPQSNTKLYYQFLIKHGNGLVDTTEYQEILEPLYSKQKSQIYSLARLSYYLYNCSQNLLTQCHQYAIALTDHCENLNSEEAIKQFDEKIQRSFSFQSLAKHAKLIFENQYLVLPDDEVLFSFHLLEEEILPYETLLTTESKSEKITAYNSKFYKLKF